MMELNIENKQNNMLLQGLKNLRLLLTGFSLDNFVLTTLEMLMLLERHEYLVDPSILPDT